MQRVRAVPDDWIYTQPENAVKGVTKRDRWSATMAMRPPECIRGSGGHGEAQNRQRNQRAQYIIHRSLLCVVGTGRVLDKTSDTLDRVYSG